MNGPAHQASAANSWVVVRLSPWAPDCIDLPWSDPRLSRRYLSTPLVKIAASTLRRLGLAPADACLASVAVDEIQLLGPVPDQAAPGVLAILWGDLTLEAIAAEIDRLRASGWKPGAWKPPVKSGDVIPFPTAKAKGAAA